MGRHGRKTRRRRGRCIALASLLALALVVTAALLLRGRLDVPARAPEADRLAAGHATPVTVSRRETGPTLDPARFSAEAALAFEVAREIPDVLDQLHCYCDCHARYGHVSLLSCYVDGHAAT